MEEEEEEERSFIAAWAWPGNSSEVITGKTQNLQEGGKEGREKRRCYVMSSNWDTRRKR